MLDLQTVNEPSDSILRPWLSCRKYYYYYCYYTHLTVSFPGQPGQQ